MDFNTSDERYETKSKKKYELSLKRSKYAIAQSHNRMKDRDEERARHEAPNFHDGATKFSESQDFKLRVSDSFIIDDTQETTEKNDERSNNFDADEVILISDSDDEVTSGIDERTSLKSSELIRDEKKGSATHRSTIYTIHSSDSEDNVRTERGTWKPKNVSEFVSMRKCSITSDETFSDMDSRIVNNNKENSFGASLNAKRTENVIPESDESIFSFDKMRGILTENARNIDNRQSPRSLQRTTGRVRDPRGTLTNDKISFERAISGEDSRENNEKIEDLRENWKSSEKSRKESGSLKNLATINRRIEDACAPSVLSNRTKNNTGSLKDITDRIHNTPKFSGISKSKTSSLNNLRGMNERMRDSRRTPEFAKTTNERTGSLSDLKNPTLMSKRDNENVKNSGETNRRREEIGKNSTPGKISSRTAVLSKKDVRNILRIVESKRVVYRSPINRKKSSNLSDSDVYESDEKGDEILSPESTVDSGNNEKPAKHVVIEETDSESEENIIRGSKVDLSKPYKTHVTRFLDPSTSHDTPECLSERKKLEIAHWLMNNAAESRSESSVSNVSASNKNSPSSGNSSLERLEMNYETPNNRDKLKKNSTDRRRRKNPPSSTKSIRLRQTTIDNFVKNSDDGNGKIFTPVSSTTRNKDNTRTQEATENLEIMDCADILDNLYGNAWREKANDLLPSTEPRKKNVLLRDKGVQTERKFNPRSKGRTKSPDSSSQEEGFDTFVRNIKSDLNSTKKPAKKPSRHKHSFIKDSSSSASESCGETTYLTALTNPRISDDRKNNPSSAPLSLHVQRAIAICDSDTDDDNEKAVDNRKILSFTDDDSSTSEYDPNEVIPPKTPTKSHGGFTKSRTATKITTKTPIFAATEKPDKATRRKNTFLESLSTTISVSEAHPDARKYRQDYKNTKEELCKFLFKLYNEKIFDNKLPSDLTIEWNVRMRGTAGFCYNKRSVKALGGITRSSRIVLATKILDTPDRLRDTLVHELCHAAAWLINEVSDGHGPFWKGWAAKAMKAFPELPPIKRCHDYKITTKYTYRCTGCGYSVGRHSKSLDVERKRCGHCYGKFELLINKVTKSGKIESKTPVTKKPTGFALFVKENYSTVKKDRKGVPHKELMQLLGQQFSAIKISKKNDLSDENNPASEA